MDDEYFVTKLLMRADVYSKSEGSAVFSKRLESLRKPRKARFVGSLLEDCARIKVSTPAGIYLGHALGMDVNVRRICDVVNRMIRGLYYEETKLILPRGIEVETLPDLSCATPEVLAVLEAQQEKSFGNRVFSYRWAATADQPLASAWLLMFFDIFPFVGVTLPRRRSNANEL